MRWNRERIGDILLRANLVSQEQLENALAEQKIIGKPLGRILIGMGVISEGQLAEVLAKQKSLPLINLAEYEINIAAATSIQEQVARRHQVIPINYEDEKLVLAMANPLDVHAIDDIRVLTHRQVVPVVSTESDIINAINRYLRGSVEQAVRTVTAEAEEEFGEEELTQEDSEAPVVKIVDSIIAEAVGREASDVHIEPQEKDFRVRYRIDGVLHEIMTMPKSIQAGIVSRLKIMSNMDIAEHRVPQDGRCSLMVDGKSVDFRLASLPSVYGENITMRILDTARALFKLEELGFMPQTLDKYKKSYTKPYGTILVTGPTGSGKSTTLYATLNVLNSPEKKIITVEDPVEYRLPGITQIQIISQAGLTFARGLRSIVRSDPDIIMVGEIRDLETAKIAIESALTGHLVLSTLHTNDAPSALTRLVEMGLEPFLVTSAVDCVLAQRLARKLCAYCKEPYTPPREMLAEAGIVSEGEVTLYRAKGCSRCFNTGYKGRIGVYEVMLMSANIEMLCIERRSSDEIRAVAMREGMKTLRDDGLEKVKQGITSLEEMLRVVV
jgi:type IV pilus assembly protein PilB